MLTRAAHVWLPSASFVRLAAVARLTEADTLNDRANLLCSDALPSLLCVGPETANSRLPPESPRSTVSCSTDLVTVKEMLEGPPDPPSLLAETPRPSRWWPSWWWSVGPGLSVDAVRNRTAEEP